MKKLGTEPAFPLVSPEYGNGYPEPGMSKRFYAACAALKSPLLTEDPLCDDDMIEDSYGYYIQTGNGEYHVPTDLGSGIRYSVNPESTQIVRVVRNAYKLAEELLKQEDEQ